MPGANESGWFFFKLNKDIARNNCWHYSYLQDVPEIRESLRLSGLNTESAKKIRNWKGQIPKQLRHAQKAELSSGADSSENEEDIILDREEGRQDEDVL